MVFLPSGNLVLALARIFSKSSDLSLRFVFVSLRFFFVQESEINIFVVSCSGQQILCWERVLNKRKSQAFCLDSCAAQNSGNESARARSKGLLDSHLELQP